MKETKKGLRVKSSDKLIERILREVIEAYIKINSDEKKKI